MPLPANREILIATASAAAGAFLSFIFAGWINYENQRRTNDTRTAIVEAKEEYLKDLEKYIAEAASNKTRVEDLLETSVAKAQYIETQAATAKGIVDNLQHKTVSASEVAAALMPLIENDLKTDTVKRIEALEAYAKNTKTEFYQIGRETSKNLGNHVFCALSKVQNDFNTTVGNTFTWVERDSTDTWWYKSSGHGADGGGVVCINK